MKIQSRDNNGLPQCGSVTSKGPTCIESNTMAFEGGKGLYCEVDQQGEEGRVKAFYSIQGWGKI